MSKHKICLYLPLIFYINTTISIHPLVKMVVYVKLFFRRSNLMFWQKIKKISEAEESSANPNAHLTLRLTTDKCRGRTGKPKTKSPLLVAGARSTFSFEYAKPTRLRDDLRSTGKTILYASSYPGICRSFPIVAITIRGF